MTHKQFGIVPVPNAPRPPEAACISDNTDCTLLNYHGGPIMQIQHVHLFLWTPSGHTVPAAFQSGMTTWLNGVIASDFTPGNPFGVDQQYYSGSGSSKRFVHYAVSNSGTIVDTAAYPKSDCTDTDATGTKLPICLTDAQLESQLSSYVTAHSLPTGDTDEYFILTPANVGSCFDSSSSDCAYTGYCGYHSYMTVGANQILYANLPWDYNVKYCDVNLAFGAGYEIGDKCAYVYGPGGEESLSGLSFNGSGYWNVALSGQQYLMQLEFDNRTKNCAIKDTDTQPKVTVSISPNPPKHGSSAKFTANVTDPAGVSAVQWYFGDGSGGIIANPVNHTYRSAGSDKLTVYVTDGHGNQTRYVETITVK